MGTPVRPQRIILSFASAVHVDTGRSHQPRSMHSRANVFRTVTTGQWFHVETEFPLAARYCEILSMHFRMYLSQRNTENFQRIEYIYFLLQVIPFMSIHCYVQEGTSKCNSLISLKLLSE